ncbi:MAG: general stress protein [Nostoc sp. ChiQUE02]|uniref:general stress protein n=1 Tax=Nostoc sp. ChiQUE02 TaxID=3075377 RepID=UPI002AD1F167|nr:general stress protein [Nostoc sp. ChiQUE02]MDZ8231748.1 general stress protein [Nostoc sp. ChiQUE02]
MTLEKERTTIGVFATSSDAQLALQELKAANFPMHKVSVIAQDAEEQSDIAGVEYKECTGNISSDDAAGGFTGSALEGLTGLLVGLVLWVIPGIGRVILAGAEATAIATTLAGGAINSTTGGLRRVLRGLGISQEQAQGYSDLVCKGYYLVIVIGIDIEIRVAKRVFNRRDIQQWGIYKPYSTPNSRYKNAVGVFSTRQDTERALTELKTAGFPMSQVSVIAKDTNTLNGLTEVDISSSKDNYTTLGIPDDLARDYEHQVSLGNYLLVVSSTDIYMAGARAILESNKVQHLRIYSQSVVNATRSDRHVISQD